MRYTSPNHPFRKQLHRLHTRGEGRNHTHATLTRGREMCCNTQKKYFCLRTDAICDSRVVNGSLSGMFARKIRESEAKVGENRNQLMAREFHFEGILQTKCAIFAARSAASHRILSAVSRLSTGRIFRHHPPHCEKGKVAGVLEPLRTFLSNRRWTSRFPVDSPRISRIEDDTQNWLQSPRQIEEDIVCEIDRPCRGTNLSRRLRTARKTLLKMHKITNSLFRVDHEDYLQNRMDQ